MTPDTLAALTTSIEHWQRLATGTYGPDEHIGASHCALCDRFEEECALVTMHDDDTVTTELCPVFHITGRPDCYDTPYYEASRLTLPSARLEYRDDPEFRRAAARELEFLRSLLPTPTPTPTP